MSEYYNNSNTKKLKPLDKENLCEETKPIGTYTDENGRKITRYETPKRNDPMSAVAKDN